MEKASFLKDLYEIGFLSKERKACSGADGRDHERRRPFLKNSVFFMGIFQIIRRD